MTESDLNYVPRLSIHRPGSQWWIIAGCIFLGGLIGYGLSFLFPAVYEATFKVTSNVILTDNPEITEFMVDNVLLHVGELANQQPLLEKVVSDEKIQALDLTPAKLKEISSVERQISTTLLKVRWADAETAAQIANTWGKHFYAMLEEGARQAVIAEELTKMQTLLENCLAGIQTPSAGGVICSLSEAELKDQITQNTDRIAAAETASLGLYRQLRVNSYEEAMVPTAPIRRERGWLIAAGAGIGFVTGLLLTEIFLSGSRKTRLQ